MNTEKRSSYPERTDMSKKYSEITPENMEKLAMQLIDYFSKKELFYDMNIYVNNKSYSSDNYDHDAELHLTDKGTKYYAKNGIDIAKQVEYSNPDTITMTFEGPLYDLINYHDYNFVEKLSKRFFNKYNLYLDQGYAWSMAAFT